MVASALAGAHLAPEGARRPAELEASGTETLERLRAKTAALLESSPPARDAAPRAALLDNPAASSAGAPAEAEGSRCAVSPVARGRAADGDSAREARRRRLPRGVRRRGAVHPAILRAQEAPDRDFALVAKRALTYLGTWCSRRRAVVWRAACFWGCRTTTGTRAAALKFAQAFAFSTRFCWTARRASLPRARRGGDARPAKEVRALASATLVGFTRGPDAADGSAARFRSAALKRASEAFEAFSGVRMFKTHLQDNGAMLDAHSSVLLLASCVLSAPYDVPGWMPAALERLGTPPPSAVRNRRTFGEFKKTHQDTWPETKAAFTRAVGKRQRGMELAPSYIS